MKRVVVRDFSDAEDAINEWSRVGLLNGKPMTMSLREFHRPRTLDQNARIHAMFRDLAEHTGYTEGEIKDYFKSEFGPRMTLDLRSDNQDRSAYIPKGTSRYTVQECQAMIERIYQVGAECGCVFSEPE